MKLLTYVARRILLSIPVLLGITLITFAIAWQANDGRLWRGYVTEKMTSAQVEAIKAQYGFDAPFHEQYFSYLERLAKLDLGVSHVASDRSVTDVYAAFFPATIELSIVALLIALAGGVFLGTMSAIRKDSPVDHATRFVALAGVSVPVFWLGLLLKFALATAYPVDLFSGANGFVKGAFLTVCYALPLVAGLFLAESVDARRASWRRVAVQAAALAAIATACVWIGWTFFGVLLLMVGGVALAVVAGLKLAKAGRVDARSWKLLLGATVLLGFAVGLSPMGETAVKAVFGLIPDFPLGARFSNDLVFIEGEHPSLTDGPTKFLLVDTLLAGDWVAFNDVLLHLVLPGITLGYASLAVIARMMRSSMLEVLSLDFVRTARAKGLPEAQVIRRHARRNALIPIATVVGLTFGGLLSGAVLTETIFQWPGLGRWSTQAILSADTNSVMNFTLLVVVIYLAANLVVDVMYSVLDPRVRLS